MRSATGSECSVSCIYIFSCIRIRRLVDYDLGELDLLQPELWQTSKSRIEVQTCPDERVYEGHCCAEQQIAPHDPYLAQQVETRSAEVVHMVHH